jgi:hypothetical protein
MSPEIRLNSKLKRTLDRIDSVPVSPNIAWSDVENLLWALADQLGGIVKYGKGSIVKVKLPNAKPTILHKPHKKVCDRGTIRALRRYLILAGVLEDGFPIE